MSGNEFFAALPKTDDEGTTRCNPFFEFCDSANSEASSHALLEIYELAARKQVSSLHDRNMLFAGWQLLSRKSSPIATQVGCLLQQAGIIR